MDLTKMRIGLVIVIALGLLAAIGQTGWQQGISLLQFNQTVDQNRIFVKGSSLQPQLARVTLTLRTPTSLQRLPVNLLIIVDRSASTDLAGERQAARQLISALQAGDQVGIASFANQATLDLALTPIEQSAAIQSALDNLNSGGATAIGEGIAVATNELSAATSSSALPVEVLLSDGFNDAGRDPLEQAKRAADKDIKLYTVGIGHRINRDLMEKLAQMTGGQFFPTFSDAISDTILKATLPSSGVLRDIQIVETLSQGFSFEGAQQNAPTQVSSNPDGSVRLEWDLAALNLNQSWTTIFSVSSSKAGSYSLNQAPSLISFSDFQGRSLSKDLPPIPMEIRPPCTPPTPAFDFSPGAPTRQDTVLFSDRSSLPGGQITHWHWEFGDGSSSEEQNPSHRYAQDGNYRVTLTVSDDCEASITRTITVFTPKLTVKRTIDAFAPPAPDETIPGQSFRVTIDIAANTDLNGLGIQETLPNTDWQLQPLESGKASMHRQGADYQWIFAEKLKSGDTRQIIYQVTVPGPDKNGNLPDTSAPGVYQINGLVSSASPELSAKITGESQIQVDNGFPIKVVVAHWNKDANSGAGGLDLATFPKHTIGFDQIQVAIGWWLNNQSVPHTSATNKDADNLKLDFKTVQTLVAYWLTGTSVFDPLPKN